VKVDRSSVLVAEATTAPFKQERKRSPAAPGYHSGRAAILYSTRSTSEYTAVETELDGFRILSRQEYTDAASHLRDTSRPLRVSRASERGRLLRRASGGDSLPRSARLRLAQLLVERGLSALLVGSIEWA
jgi:hypothetical protein